MKIRRVRANNRTRCFEADTPRGRVFSLAARVTGGALELSWEYSSALHREDTVRALAQQLMDELETIKGITCRPPVPPNTNS